MKTGEGLALFAEKAADAKTPYIYATFGQILTERKLAEVRKLYPERLSEARYQKARNQYIGKRTTDCYGLVKWYKWTGGDAENPSLNDNPIYNAKEDCNANTAYERAKVKGPISTIPERRGICVRYPGHVGVYLGNGKVSEARGFDPGTTITNLKERKWTHWFEEDGIKYEKDPEPQPQPQPGGDKCMIEIKVLRKGSKDSGKENSVKSLQSLLNTYGYKDQNGNRLEVDGSFGGKTDYAVKAFQKKVYPECGEVDGVVGSKTWTKLIEG